MIMTRLVSEAVGIMSQSRVELRAFQCTIEAAKPARMAIGAASTTNRGKESAPSGARWAKPAIAKSPNSTGRRSCAAAP